MGLAHSASGDELRVLLPGGIWLDERRTQEAWIRPLTGVDERFLVEQCASLSASARSTVLLARAVTTLGDSSATPEAIRLLTAGDREALLLELRRLTLGEYIDCVLTCPGSGCGDLMDVPLRVGDLLLRPYEDASPFYVESFLVEDTEVSVRFRLPTGGDQEAVAAQARRDLPGAARLILRRCIERIEVDGQTTDDLPPAAAPLLVEAMARLDPQAELLLQLRCPACSTDTSALFDTGSYFLKELTGRRGALDLEIHSIALHYHWSERDILRLTPRRRRTYLELLADRVGVVGAA